MVGWSAKSDCRMCWPLVNICYSCKLQNAIAADGSEQETIDRSCELRGSDDGSSDSDGEDDDDDDDDDDEVIDLSGMKCRAPYTHSWGEMSFHNAMILCILPDQAQVCIARYSSYLTKHR